MYVNSTWTPPHWTIPPIALEERLTRFLFSAQQTLQDAERQNKPLATSTSRPMNATTTANVSYRPVQ